MAKLKERSMYEEDEDFPNDEEDARNPNQSNNLLFSTFSFQNELKNTDDIFMPFPFHSHSTLLG